MVTAAVFAIVMLLGLALVLTWRSQDQERLDDARKESCVALERLKTIQRAGVAQELEATRGFLQEHPSGIFGLPRQALERSILRNERTLRDLAPTEC